MMNNTIQNIAYYTIKEYNNIYNTLNITILMLNIRSFNKNINTFNIFLDTLVSKPDIIVLTETWLTDTMILQYIKQITKYIKQIVY